MTEDDRVVSSFALTTTISLYIGKNKSTPKGALC